MLFINRMFIRKIDFILKNKIYTCSVIIFQNIIIILKLSNFRFLGFIATHLKKNKYIILKRLYF